MLVCIAALAIIIVPKLWNHKPTEVSAEDSRRLDSLEHLLEKVGVSHEKNTLFSFDPNTISVDSLQLLGFPIFMAERVDKYRKMGGRFYTKEDLKKIYGLSMQRFSRVYDYINLPDSSSRAIAEKHQLPMDINEVNAHQLKEIHMIGDVLASRIVKYREMLGGYISKEQLREVFGLSDEALNGMKMSVFISEGFKSRLIKINSNSLKALKSHPYISNQLAEDILRFRSINSTIESEKVLANFKSVDKSNFEKLIFYLDFQ